MTNRPANPMPDGDRPGIVPWLRARVDLEPLVALLRRKPVPIHRHSWIYALGDTAVFLFALQLATGCLLMLYYQPAEASAHQSVCRIMTEVPYGWLVRSVHAWGASFLIGVAGLHLVTVALARAYRKPRELTWISGVLLLAIVMGSGFSGYLLPWNELSYYATRVGTQIPGKAPGIGAILVRFLRGGDQLTGETITRFFAAHVMLAPLGLGFVLLVHTLLSRVRGVALPPGTGKQDVKDQRPFFSEFLPREACAWLLLLGTIATVAVCFPAAIGVQADPLKPAPEGIKPEWYFLFLFQVLKLVPETVALALFALAGAFLFALPFLDRGGRGKRVTFWTALFVLLLACAAALEAVAWAAPGVKHPPEQWNAPTYELAGNLVVLVLLWLVIGFLTFYLHALAGQNSRIRKLYQGR